MKRKILSLLLLALLLLTTACESTLNVSPPTSSAPESTLANGPLQPSPPIREPLFTYEANLTYREEYEKIVIDYLPEDEAVDADARRISVYMGDQLVWSKDMIMGCGFGMVGLQDNVGTATDGKGNEVEIFDYLFYWECVRYDDYGYFIHKAEIVYFSEDGTFSNDRKAVNINLPVVNINFHRRDIAEVYSMIGDYVHADNTLILVDTSADVLCESKKDQPLKLPKDYIIHENISRVPEPSPFVSKIRLKYDVNGDGKFDYICLNKGLASSTGNLANAFPTVIYNGSDHSILFSDRHYLGANEKGGLYLRLNEATGQTELFYWYYEKSTDGQLKFRYNTFSFDTDNRIVSTAEATKTYTLNSSDMISQQASAFSEMQAEINQKLKPDQNYTKVYVILETHGTSILYSTPLQMVEAAEISFELSNWSNP